MMDYANTSERASERKSERANPVNLSNSRIFSYGKAAAIFALYVWLDSIVA